MFELRQHHQRGGGQLRRLCYGWQKNKPANLSNIKKHGCCVDGMPTASRRVASKRSAADSGQETHSMVTEAITMVPEEWSDQGSSLNAVTDLGVMRYRTDPEYASCSAWLILYADVLKTLMAQKSPRWAGSMHTECNNRGSYTP